MNYRVIVVGVMLALAGGCGGGSNNGDGGADGAAMPTALFMGSYTATTNVSAEVNTVRDVATMAEHAEAYRWAMAQTLVAAGSPVATLLARVDREFQGDAAASSDFGLDHTVRHGLTLGLAATTDAQRDVAHETVAKPLDVALGLGAQSELRAAVADAQANNMDSARAHWDRAAVYFSGLEPSVREYSNQTVPGVWGARDALASSDIAALIIDQLRRGRAAIDAGAQVSAIELGSQLQVALTRLYFLSGVKYSRVIENAVAAMAEIDPAAQAEGTYAFEGVLLTFAGLQPSAAVGAARTHWRAEARTITEAQLLRDAAAVYTEANASALAGYTTATDNARFATIARLNGALDALAEALAYAGQDVSALRNQLVAARGLSVSGNHAGALEALTQVQTAIGRVGTTP